MGRLSFRPHTQISKGWLFKYFARKSLHSSIFLPLFHLTASSPFFTTDYCPDYSLHPLIPFCARNSFTAPAFMSNLQYKPGSGCFHAAFITVDHGQWQSIPLNHIITATNQIQFCFKLQGHLSPKLNVGKRFGATVVGKKKVFSRMMQWNPLQHWNGEGVAENLPKQTKVKIVARL